MHDEEESTDSQFSFDWEKEEWVLAGHALRDAVELYVAAGNGDRLLATTDAISALRYRLKSGWLWARAPRWTHSVNYNGVAEELAATLHPSHIQGSDEDIIGPEFWWNLEQAELAEPDEWSTARVRMDWVSGDIEFRLESRVDEGPVSSVTVSGLAIGLCFNRSGLPTTPRITSGGPVGKVRSMQRNENPRLPEAMLQAWWSGLDEEAKSLPQRALEDICRGSFPRHHVSRDRIRALIPSRKPGPKPLCDKTPAQLPRK